MIVQLLHHDKAIYSPLSPAQIILIVCQMHHISLPPGAGSITRHLEARIPFECYTISDALS